MSRSKIVQFSELGSECWSAYRFFDDCHKCPYVGKCRKRGEHARLAAARGRVRLATETLEKAQVKAYDAEMALKEAREEVVGLGADSDD